MQKVKLLTRHGEFVCMIVMPTFIIMPEIVIWGSRHFVWHEDKEEYREGCAIVVWSESEMAVMYGINVKQVSEYVKRPKQ